MSRLSSILSLAAITLLTAACGSSSSQAPASKPRAQKPVEVRAAGESPALTSCVSMMTRQRACTDLYIPALVDLRREKDSPRGIAAADRDAIIAQAHQEWAADSTDAAIQSTCIGLVDQYGERLEPIRLEVEACLAQTDCQAFVDCIIPVTATWWSSRD